MAEIEELTLAFLSSRRFVRASVRVDTCLGGSCTSLPFSSMSCTSAWLRSTHSFESMERMMEVTVSSSSVLTGAAGDGVFESLAALLWKRLGVREPNSRA